MNVDNRRFARIPFDAAIHLSMHNFSNENYRGTLRDISLKGAMVALDIPSGQPLPLADQQYELSIQPYQSDLRINMTVDIAYCLTNEAVFGLNIRSFDIESAGHLRRLIEMNLGDDAILQRELQSLIEAMEDEQPN